MIGFYITPLKYLYYYLFLIILIFLDWKNNKECTLTKQEYYFKYGDTSDTTRYKREFFRPIFNRLFNTNITSNQSNSLSYISFKICFILGFIRLIRYYHVL